MKYICPVCGYVHNGEHLPERCPMCGVFSEHFEKMDKYQTYEYFKDGDRMIIFINENSSNQMTEKEIFESVINLM